MSEALCEISILVRDCDMERALVEMLLAGGDDFRTKQESTIHGHQREFFVEEYFCYAERELVKRIERMKEMKGLQSNFVSVKYYNPIL